MEISSISLPCTRSQHCFWQQNRESKLSCRLWSSVLQYFPFGGKVAISYLHYSVAWHVTSNLQVQAFINWLDVLHTWTSALYSPKEKTRALSSRSAAVSSSLTMLACKVTASIFSCSISRSLIQKKMKSVFGIWRVILYFSYFYYLERWANSISAQFLLG